MRREPAPAGDRGAGGREAASPEPSAAAGLAAAGLDAAGLLTARQVARMFRVTPQTVLRWSQSGQLQAVHVHRSRRLHYHAAEVRSLLLEVRPEPAGGDPADQPEPVHRRVERAEAGSVRLPGCLPGASAARAINREG